jgi:hypothetical protein
MKTTLPGLLLLALGAATIRVNSLAAEEVTGPLLKWEYRVLTKDQVLDLGNKDLRAGLNRLGDEGWELAVTEPSYIFKRPRIQIGQRAEEIKRRVALAENDVEMWKARVAWAERMVKKGYMTDTQLQGETAVLNSAQIVLERARKELQALPPEKENKPEK